MVKAGFQNQYCANHPDRAGSALCMTCRKIVCQECATQWDGINYCVACLALRRDASRESSTALQWVLWAAVVLGLFFVASHLIVWTGVNFARMF